MLPCFNQFTGLTDRDSPEDGNGLNKKTSWVLDWIPLGTISESGKRAARVVNRMVMFSCLNQSTGFFNWNSPEEGKGLNKTSPGWLNWIPRGIIMERTRSSKASGRAGR